MPLRPPLPAGFVRGLREALGDDAVRAEPADLEPYGRDETESLFFPPQAVALPSSTEEVSRVLQLASQHEVPVTPRGAGTGLSGGALPVRGGLVLSLQRLARIRRIDAANLVAEVEAGVVTAELQRRVEEAGLFYPPDPSSRESCLIGGNLAEDAAGPRSCKYGTTRKWVLGLEAVLVDGTVIRTGGANRKDVAGYDLTQLLVGSEGTLAVITAAVLRLTALPRARLTLLLPFADLESGADAVQALFREGHDPSACELVERGALDAVARVLPLPASLEEMEAVIVLELDGNDPEELLERAAAIEELATRIGAGEVLAATDADDQRRLWDVRRKVGEAVKGLSDYKEADTVVPRSRLADLVRAARRAAQEQGLRAICYGHAGDGNLHINLLRGDLGPEEWERRRDAAERKLFEEVVALGGSITGEHGIGWTQRQYLPLRLAPRNLELLTAIKGVFDPRGLLNPDKALPLRG